MTDEKPDLRTSLLDAWEEIFVLEEKVTDLDLHVSAILTALAKTSPSFAMAFDQAYKDALAERERHESELPANVQEELRRRRKGKR